MSPPTASGSAPCSVYCGSTRSRWSGTIPPAPRSPRSPWPWTGRGTPWPARYPPAAPRRTSRSPTTRRPTTRPSPASCTTCCSRSTSGRRPCSALCPEPCRAGEAAPARSPGGLWIAALRRPGAAAPGGGPRTAAPRPASSRGAWGLREPGRARAGGARGGRRDDGPDVAVGSVVQVDDDRGVVAWPGALACFPVDPRGAYPAGDGVAGEDEVDAHAQVLVEHPGPVVPVGEDALVWPPVPDDVVQAGRLQAGQRGPLWRGNVGLPDVGGGVEHIGVRGRDVH